MYVYHLCQRACILCYLLETTQKLSCRLLLLHLYVGAVRKEGRERTCCLLQRTNHYIFGKEKGETTVHIVWFPDPFFPFSCDPLASISLAKAGGTAPLSLLLISLAYLSTEDNVSEHACAHGLCHQIQIGRLPATSTPERRSLLEPRFMHASVNGCVVQLLQTMSSHHVMYILIVVCIPEATKSEGYLVGNNWVLEPGNLNVS